MTFDKQQVEEAKPTKRPFVTPVTKNDEWATPPAFFDAWNRKLRFTVDGAASDANAKLPRFWSRQDDALSLSWANERVWLNPPWSNVRPFVGKALSREADVCGLLLPARTDRPWHEELRQDDGVFLQYVGRVAFIDPESRGRTSPREGAMIAVVL